MTNLTSLTNITNIFLYNLKSHNLIKYLVRFVSLVKPVLLIRLEIFPGAWQDFALRICIPKLVYNYLVLNSHFVFLSFYLWEWNLNGVKNNVFAPLFASIKPSPLLFFNMDGQEQKLVFFFLHSPSKLRGFSRATYVVQSTYRPLLDTQETIKKSHFIYSIGKGLIPKILERKKCGRT